MLASPTIAVGSENRRLACDRCRGQKLKCIREEDSPACRRCISAKAHCVFGYPNPPGRPPAASRTNAEQSNQGQQHQQYQNQHNHQHQAHRPNSSPASIIPPPLLPTTIAGDQLLLQHTSGNSHVDNTLLLDMLYNTSIDTMGFRNTPLQPEPGTPKITDGRGSQNPSLAAHPRAPSPETVESSIPSWDMSLTNDEPTVVPTDLFTPDLSPSNSATSAADAAAMRNQCIEQLLHLTADMYRLQDRCFTFGGPNPCMEPPGYFPSELAGLVMKLASTFLSLAESITDDQRFAFGSSTNGGDDPSMSILAENQVLSSRRSSRATSQATSPNYSTTTSSNRSSTYCPSFENDTSFALQLIACYLRLLQLYQLLYTAILDHIRSSDSDPQVRQPVWADLNVGGATLSAFPELQMRLIVQASAQVMSRIEQKLGLHEDYRLSRRTSHEGRGVLGAMNVPPQLIKICMEESLVGQGQGRGLIMRVADLAERLDDLLSTPEKK